MSSRPAPSDVAMSTAKAWHWDIFCRVIDNHGDLGVCWRLSADLAERGHHVRLWVDDASALAWMAPAGHPRVQVLPWTDTPLDGRGMPGDVTVEAFGCELPSSYQAALFQAAMARPQKPPVWINLEYLSAESYVARSHGLPSPVLAGPAKGLTKWFFYPGFTPGTGGLIREPGTMAHEQAPSAPQSTASSGPSRALRISLFCYEPPALAAWVQGLRQAAHPVHLWVAAGRSQAAIKRCLPPTHRHGSALNLRHLPYLTQPGYDCLLRHADLNFVRGEDSLVRALWAGRPLIWHIYPQHDGAHHDKLEAFLAMSQAPECLRDYHRRWNADQPLPLPELTPQLLHPWRAWAQSLRQRLLQQPDLSTQLIAFVVSKR